MSPSYDLIWRDLRPIVDQPPTRYTMIRINPYPGSGSGWLSKVNRVFLVPSFVIEIRPVFSRAVERLIFSSRVNRGFTAWLERSLQRFNCCCCWTLVHTLRSSEILPSSRAWQLTLNELKFIFNLLILLLLLLFDEWWNDIWSVVYVTVYYVYGQ